MRDARRSGGQILAQNGHLELEAAVAVLVLEDDADELVIDIDFGRVFLLARLHLDAAVVERALQVRLEALDVGVFHGGASGGFELGGDPREGPSGLKP